MRTREEIDQARRIVTSQFLKRTTPPQEVLLVGLSTALQWVAGEGGNTLQQLVDGRPFGESAAGSDPVATAAVHRWIETHLRPLLNDRQKMLEHAALLAVARDQGEDTETALAKFVASVVLDAAGISTEGN